VGCLATHLQAATDPGPHHAVRRPSRGQQDEHQRPGAPTSTGRRPQVLFVCVHNAGRSQMAAALLEHYASGRVDVRSAGSTPAAEINPAVRAAMAEIGIDLDGAHPKLLTTDAAHAADVVVTMGCGDTCPVFPGKRYLDWDLTDPASKRHGAAPPSADELRGRAADQSRKSPNDQETNCQRSTSVLYRAGQL
jgi:arsenate reductase